MSRALIELVGEDVLCSVVDGADTRLPYAAAAARLAKWAARYDAAAARDVEAELLAIGREMFGWLDEARWASDWADGAGDRELEIRVRRRDDPREVALLDAPWELLARDNSPLGLDATQLFTVARRIGAPAAVWEPRHHGLQLMFMAAAPQGQVDLDFEREEATVLAATRGDGRVHVIVEETGSLEFLRGRLASEEGPFDAVHLSCHGDIDKRRGPVLLLETAEGGADPVDPGQVVQALGAIPAPLVVLSACRTTEIGRASGAADGVGRRDAGDRRIEPDVQRDGMRPPGDVGAEIAASFARQLATQVANVVGWDGSVYDRDATDFAQAFYGELGRGSPVPRAAAVARRTLLQQHSQDRQRGRHWHLARVYLGPSGGGALCAAGKPKRKDAGQLLERAFLDKDKKRVPVATRAEFVGRRRAIQSVLRAFRDGAGVLVHGMGALGKSSLAARVLSRMPHRPVLIFERYDALAIFDEVLGALAPAQRLTERAAWRERVKADPACLEEALETWLTGPLDANPILLVVDDLERILETPTPTDTAAKVMVAAEYRVAMGAVLLAFERAQTASRLLLTSRYDVRHPDDAGGDLAAALVRIPLAPMPERERSKQLRAAERVAGREDGATGEAVQELLSRALVAAAGNPGLQAILTRPVLTGELGAAEEALRQIGVYRESGVPPAEIQALIEAGAAKDSENALTAFFARLSFATYRAALTGDQERQLAAATLFAEEVPIPRAALEAAGAALGVEDAAVAVGRLLALGLFDDFGEIEGAAHAACNALARPLALPLGPDDRPRMARAALAALAAAWRSDDGSFPFDHRGVAAAMVALEAEAEPEMLEAAGFAGAAWLERVQGATRDALALVERVVDALPPGYAADPGFVRLGVECADSVGEIGLLERLLAFPTRASRPDDMDAARQRAALDLRRAERLARTGAVAAADDLTRSALTAFQKVGDERMVAFAARQIADILQARGDTDEALRIRQEEELPVFFERLGEVRERAITMGRIADILQARGDTDEALRIRQEEQLPVYDRLGDVRSRAITMSKIADILQARGDTDEALRIRQEEELPVYERLGDVRSRAITMGKIADILQARGDTDEALRIHKEEQLPVYERLGEVRSRAITMGQIADILQARGKTDEALRIRREEELPVYEHLGDVRSRAIAMGKIADILQASGEADEALRIRQEEQLPVFERLGEVRSRAITMGKIADILQARGDTDEALRIHKEEELPVYQRLGDVRSRAITMGQIADILRDRGETDEALRIREEQLPVYDRLGDVRSRAITMGKIADILEDRGETDEALRIRQEEELPVYERLGEVRSRAITMGQIADILQARGDTDEALRIRQEEELPVYQRLGEVRERAITMGKIADILLARGETDEALRIRRDEELPVYDRLGDVRSRAITMGRVADILQARGETDEALRIRQEEQLPVYERLGDVRSRSVTLQKIAAGLIAAGGLEQGRSQEIYDALAEAFDIARKLRLPDGIAFIGIELADILARAGQRDEALGVLDEAEAGFRVLGHAEGVEHVGRMREAIRGNGKDAPKTERGP